MTHLRYTTAAMLLALYSHVVAQGQSDVTHASDAAHFTSRPTTARLPMDPPEPNPTAKAVAQKVSVVAGVAAGSFLGYDMYPNYESTVRQASLAQTGQEDHEVVDEAYLEQEFAGYSLLDLEGLAAATNPALAEAASRVEAVKGRAWQASLPPNPTVGYIANELGNAGSAGQHGAYWSRQFVRGGKLQLSRAVECREVYRQQQEYDVLRQRILTDVRTTFYEMLLLQRRLELLGRILTTNNRATTIATKLFDAGENTKNDVLLLELEAEQTSTDMIAVQTARTAKWRVMQRLLGQPGLMEGLLIEPTDEYQISWEEAVSLVQQSPQLSAVNAEIARNRAALQRAMVEPIPDLKAQVSVQYDFATDHTFTGIQLGMNIPKFDKNQGAIYEANSNVRAALQKAQRVELALERNLAETYGIYEKARRQLARIDEVIVPKAEEVVRIALGAYAAGEASLADVLNAQRSLLRSLVRQLDAKQELRLSYVAIQGFLLSDGLNAG